MKRALYDPWSHAAELGIPVLVQPLRRSHGLWLPDHRTILIADHIKPWAHRCILAHEIGHAVLGHEDDPPEHEWAADQYAARRLLTDESVSRALARYQGDTKRAAGFLRVTTRLLTAYASPVGPSRPNELPASAERKNPRQVAARRGSQSNHKEHEMTRTSVAEPVSSVSAALTGEIKTVVVDRGMHLPSVVAEAGLSERMARDLSGDRHEWTIAELSRVAGVLQPDDAAEEFARLTSVAVSAPRGT